jgi:hypothetical protein
MMIDIMTIQPHFGADNRHYDLAMEAELSSLTQ